MLLIDQGQYLQTWEVRGNFLVRPLRLKKNAWTGHFISRQLLTTDYLYHTGIILGEEDNALLRFPDTLYICDFNRTGLNILSYANFKQNRQIQMIRAPAHDTAAVLERLAAKLTSMVERGLTEYDFVRNNCHSFTHEILDQDRFMDVHKACLAFIGLACVAFIVC